MENLTTETFKEKVFDFTQGDARNLNGNKPIIIKFSASWCAPCKMITPILEELSNEYKEIDFYMIDVEEQPEIAAAFQIRNVPSVFFISTTGEQRIIVGASPKEKYKQTLKEVFDIK